MENTEKYDFILHEAYAHDVVADKELFLFILEYVEYMLDILIESEFDPLMTAIMLQRAMILGNEFTLDQAGFYLTD